MSCIKLVVTSLVFGLLISVGAGPASAGITNISPPSGDTLAGASQAFGWAGTGITEYWLYVGTSQGGNDIHDSGTLLTAINTTVTGLPTSGGTLHVRLWHREGGVWLFTDFVYTASGSGGSGGGGLSAVPPWSQILPAAERFVLVMGDVAVLDKETGLVWDRRPSTTPQANWGAAITHCATREVGGRKGWELPMRNQLASLVDSSNSNPALPTGHPFLTVQSAVYWSASSAAVVPNTAWVVNFSNGSVGGSTKSGAVNLAWCVRGGQSFDGNTHNTLH